MNLSFRFPKALDITQVEQLCLKESLRLKAAGVMSRQQLDTVMAEKSVFTAGDHYRIKELQKQLRLAKPKRTLTFYEEEDLVINHILMEIFSGVRLLGTEQNLFKEEIKYPAMYQELRKLVGRLNKFYQASLETQVQDYRMKCLMVRSVFDGERQLWADLSEMEQSYKVTLMQQLLLKFSEFWGGLSPKIVRMVARSSAWHLRWVAATQTGSQLFPDRIIDWNVNQLSLCYWSMFYDNLSQHPEAPKGDHLDNDEMVDSWVEQENNKSRKGVSSQGNTGKSSDTQKVIFKR